MTGNTCSVPSVLTAAEMCCAWSWSLVFCFQKRRASKLTPWEPTTAWRSNQWQRVLRHGRKRVPSLRPTTTAPYPHRCLAPSPRRDHPPTRKKVRTCFLFQFLCGQSKVQTRDGSTFKICICFSACKCVRAYVRCLQSFRQLHSNFSSSVWLHDIDYH